MTESEKRIVLEEAAKLAGKMGMEIQTREDRIAALEAELAGAGIRDGKASWYEADGSVVMLPIAEWIQCRKQAAVKLTALATELASLRNLYAAQEERYERGRKDEDYARDRLKSVETQLAAANEKCAELAAALEKTDQAFEMFAAYQGGCCCEHISTDETAPGECVLCDIDRGARQHGNPSAILAAVREKARREGMVEAMKRFAAVWTEEPPVSEGGRWISDLLADEIAALEVEG